MKTLPLVILIGTLTACRNNLDHHYLKAKEITKHNALISNKSYAIVTCDKCKIVYNGPGQNKQLNISGTSPKLVYNYSSGKTLKASIYPIGEDQDIVYAVYNTKGRIVYYNNVDQDTGDSWDVDVLLP